MPLVGNFTTDIKFLFENENTNKESLKITVILYF